MDADCGTNILRLAAANFLVSRCPLSFQADEVSPFVLALLVSSFVLLRAPRIVTHATTAPRMERQSPAAISNDRRALLLCLLWLLRLGLEGATPSDVAETALAMEVGSKELLVPCSVVVGRRFITLVVVIELLHRLVGQAFDIYTSPKRDYSTSTTV